MATPLPCDTHILNLRTLSEPAFPTAPSKEALLVLHRTRGDCELNYVTGCGGDNSYGPDFGDFLAVSRVATSSLTGVSERKVLASLSEVEVEPMTLQGVKVTF